MASGSTTCSSFTFSSVPWILSRPGWEDSADDCCLEAAKKLEEKKGMANTWEAWIVVSFTLEVSRERACQTTYFTKRSSFLFSIFSMLFYSDY